MATPATYLPLPWDVSHLFNLQSLAFVVALALLVTRISAVLNSLKAVNYLPGIRSLFGPLNLPAVLFPTSWWINGLDMHVARRRTLYKNHDTFSVVPLVGNPSIYTSNLEVMRQVVGGTLKESTFVKPAEASLGLSLFGVNLISSDGDMWRKHRRVMGPAFNNKLFNLVWDQTINTYREMILAEGWHEKDVVEVPVVQRVTLKLTFIVLSACGLGIPSKWSDPPTSPDGTLTIQEALRVVSDNNLFMIFAPRWLRWLPFRRFQEPFAAHDQLETIADGVDNLSRNNAFSLLVKANEDEGKLRLDDEELIGNVYSLLQAGHETTSNGLAATLGFMALYEDIQEEIFEHIASVVGYSRDPTFEDYNKLNKVLAVFCEALRMFPAGHMMIRASTEDTILQVPKPRSQQGSNAMPIFKDIWIIVDMIGVQSNPRYFESPEEYKPSRWYNTLADSEAYTAFSIGPRTCIGKKFATTEAVGFLTAILRDWKVRPILKKDETREAWGMRVLTGKLEMTLGVHDVPVTFSRRS